jgi:hypothetical protein
MAKTYNHDRANVVEFSSLDDMVASIKDTRHCDAHGETDPDWYGSANFGESLKMASDGWSAIRGDVDAIMSRIKDRIKDVTPTVFDMGRDVSGLFVDMGAFMSGEPECMLYPVPVASPRSSKVVRIHYNTGAMAYVNGDVMIKRGVAVLALVDALNTLGVNCEIWAESAAKNGARKAVVLACIKEAHEPMDINRLMFVLANPSYHRRFNFAARVQFGLAGIKNGGDCGSMPLHMADKVNADVTVHKAHNVGDAIAEDPDGWILGELDRLGFTVN